MILEFIKTRNICTAVSIAADCRDCYELFADTVIWRLF